MGNIFGKGPQGYWFTTTGGNTDYNRVLLSIIIFICILAGLIATIILTIPGSNKSEDKNAYYLAAGIGESTTKTLLWSVNGINWLDTVGSFESFGREVKFFNGTSLQWIAVGTDSSDIRGTILWSTDGKSWNKILSGGFKFGITNIDGGYSIVYNSSLGIWVATGGRIDGDEVTSTIQWSSNGKNWNFATSGGFTNRGIEIYYDDNRKTFIATGVDDDEFKSIQTSTDGKIWTTASGSTFSGGGLSVTGKNL